MSDPYFSIIIPTYNREKSITNCLKSVINQTFSDFEILVIDNKSTDNTIDKIKNFSDERIKLFSNDKNYERCYSRNKGMKNATGEYITFLDSDDLLLPNHLQNWFDFILKKKKENSFYICNKLICKDNEEVIKPSHTKYEDIENLLKSPVIPGQTCIPYKIANSFQFETDYLIFEDTALWLQMAMKFEIQTAHFNSYSYSVNNDNSVNVKKNNFGAIRCCSIKNFMSQNPDIVSALGSRLFKIELSKSIFAIAKFYMANQNRIKALQNLIKSISIYPTLFQLKHKCRLIILLLLNKEIKEYGFKLKNN
jgi:glycosyltransferase involved in cell wall biosynthesis